MEEAIKIDDEVRDLQIDDEFRDLLSPLTEGEYKDLEQSILDEGCREAIVLWGDIIIDGHNRYRESPESPLL